jgi:hypothetical protein
MMSLPRESTYNTADDQARLDAMHDPANWEKFEGAEINGVWVPAGESADIGGVTYNVGRDGWITMGHT